MDDISQNTKKAILASEELDLDDSEDEPTPTGSLSSLGCGSVNSVSTITSFKSALSNGDESFSGSISSFKSIGTESVNSFSSARSFKSARSTTDTEFGSALSNSNSLRSLGAHSFKSCSTYASFKSAKSHTDNEENGHLTPTNSLGSFFGGSVDSFQSFKSARSGTTYNEDDTGEMFGSIGSLESFVSFKTFASFKNAKSDLSLSETITGDNDFASLHRFCTDSSMEKGINDETHLDGDTDDEEEDFLDISHNDTLKPIQVEENGLPQEPCNRIQVEDNGLPQEVGNRIICNTNSEVEISDVAPFEKKSESTPSPVQESKIDNVDNQSFRSSSESR